MSSLLGKLRKPVIGNVDPPRDPGVLSAGDMPKNPVEGTDAAGPADYSQVQPDRHHLRGMRPFAMQPVEGVDRVSGEIGGGRRGRSNSPSPTCHAGRASGGTPAWCFWHLGPIPSYLAIVFQIADTGLIIPNCTSD